MKNISVIIPTYQHAGTLPDCLKSIREQTLKPKEVIVVDDGSTDNTAEVVKPFLNEVTYIYQKNAGAPAARNNGFKESSGNFVIFWDADIVARPEMLEILVRALNKHPDASWAYSDFRWGNKLFPSRTFDEQRLRENNYIHTSSLIRREDFPGFDESLKRFQDWDLWLTMSTQGKRGVYVHQELFEVKMQKKRRGISEWMPAFMYKIPWEKIGWMPGNLKKYYEARNVIEQKHKL